MIKKDLRDQHDKRAQQLGFEDRIQMRKAINIIANSMSEDEYMSLSQEEMESLLKNQAKLIR
jgi:hypothetical protein